uniref:Uncharacterized protein n=1 Tax=Alexandrium monilatum TaxID=311494 RepID=A0A7S4Q5J7_9DINO|mmetsp:Transcript_10898/g.32843  ORF Transcript_10898/g.32843 Transcript_10898/m.32843 type:complete len:213 (+) Transcript_10898:38-676(+)
MGQSISSVEEDSFERHGPRGLSCSAPLEDDSICLSSPTANDAAAAPWSCTRTDPTQEFLEVDGGFGVSDWRLRRTGGRPPLDAAYGLSHLQIHRAASLHRQRAQTSPSNAALFQRMDTLRVSALDSTGSEDDNVRRMNTSDSAFGLSSWQLFREPSMGTTYTTPRYAPRMRLLEEEPELHATREKRCRMCTTTDITEWCTEPSADDSLERPG